MATDVIFPLMGVFIAKAGVSIPPELPQWRLTAHRLQRLLTDAGLKWLKSASGSFNSADYEYSQPVLNELRSAVEMPQPSSRSYQTGSEFLEGKPSAQYQEALRNFFRLLDLHSLIQLLRDQRLS